MHKLFPLLFSLLIASAAIAQKTPSESQYKPELYNAQLSVMSEEDSIYLSNLPELPIPDLYLGSDAPVLPTVVDNSVHPWFRPVFQQHGYSCGQAALVGYNFTYEINRARGLEATSDETQYPTHFTWNFDNAANYYGGVSFFHSIEILREVGNPNCAYYGGMSGGGKHDGCRVMTAITMLCITGLHRPIS